MPQQPQPQRRSTGQAPDRSTPRQAECVGTYLSPTKKLFYPTIHGGPSGNWRRSNTPGDFAITSDMAGVYPFTQVQSRASLWPGLKLRVTLQLGAECHWVGPKAYEVEALVTAEGYRMKLTVDIEVGQFTLA